MGADSFVFLGFNLHAWITIATVLTMFSVLLFTKLRSDLVFLGAIAILFVTGVLDAKEAFSGFSSTSVVVVGVLFVVVAGLMHTGVLQWIVKHLLGQPKSYSGAVARLMLPVAALSSFLSNTTLVAVARRGERVEESPREVLLKAGDTLLFECSPQQSIGTDRLSSQLHFFDSEQVPNIGPKTLISTTIMLAMVVLSALKIIPLLQCAFLAAMAMLLFRCCNADQAMKAINWNILMVFAGSVVLGTAIQKTGIAERQAYGILDVCGTNPIVVMTAICLVATFITEFISNTAAGAMFFPIMYEAAIQLGYEPYPFLIALMISVSSSFATPIGSPTHMLVYAPGGYRFSDFMRIGLLMNFIILAANIFIVNIIYPLTPLP